MIIIDIYKKEIDPRAKEKEAKINVALIALRRRYHLTVKNDLKAKHTTDHFSKVCKSKSVEQLVSMIRYLLRRE